MFIQPNLLPQIENSTLSNVLENTDLNYNTWKKVLILSFTTLIQ